MSLSSSIPLADASDAELITRTRSGSDDAYAELFTRHRGIALGVARKVAGPDHADDLVADAFLKVLAVLRAGGGPDHAFRGYLLTTVRNLHLNTIRATRRESLVPDYEDVERHLVLEDGVDDLLDGHAVSRAFAALPERWRTVLWLGAVEGRSNDEIAGMLDLKPNAVAALSFRARDGLREAYLADHLQAAQDPRCRRITDLLPAYVRGTLTGRRQSLVAGHLDGCARCSGLVAELSLVEADLAAYLAPLLFVPLLGTAAAGVGSSALGWFTKLGAFGKAAVLTAAVGPLLTATVVTGAALRGEEGPSDPGASALVEKEPRAVRAAGVPVRRPDQADPARVDAARPAAAEPVDAARAAVPVDGRPAAAEPVPAAAEPDAVGPSPEPQPDLTAVPTAAPTDRTAHPSPGRLLRRVVHRVLRIVEPAMDATVGTAGLLAGTGPSLGLLGSTEPAERR